MLPEAPTTATGGSAASQAASLDERSWKPRRGLSFSIRALTLAAPFVASLLMVKIVVHVFGRPAGVLPFIGWIAGMIALSTIVSLVVHRAFLLLAPLGFLFKMSLVFPDEAPSRFATALRAGSTRRLEHRLAQPTGATTEAQAGAENLIALMTRLNKHDRLTRGHSERVRAYSVMLGEEIGLSRDDLDKLNWAALAHDVGKLDVPEALLNKPGRPTDAEWTTIRRHPAAGAAYVEPLREWLGDWVHAATQHHERYDGGGYPNGLAGDQISLAGRIVAIADAYDVMTAVRSYKPPLPIAQARAELTRNSGTQFDPQLVRSFLAIGLGRMRAVLGPLGWAASLPDVMRTPLSAIGGATTSSVATGAAVLAASVGVIDSPREPVPDPPMSVELSTAEVDPVDISTTSTSVVVAIPFADAIVAYHRADAAPAASTTTQAPQSDPTVPTTTVAPTTTADAATPAPTTAPPTTAPPTTAPPTTAPPTTAPPTTAPPITVVAGATVADDSVAVKVNGSVSVHVLDNDDFGSGDVDASTLTITSPPAHGQAQVAGRNIVYDSEAGFTGTDSLVYSVCAADGPCGTATVTISVTP